MALMSGSRVLLVAFALAIVAPCVAGAPVVKAFKGPRGLASQFSAQGTFNARDFAQNGHCGFGLSKSMKLAWRRNVVSVAIPTLLYNNSYLCGLCIAFKARTKNNPFKLTWQYGIVADDCPRCKKNDIVVVGKGSGFHPIWWQPIQCNPGKAPMQYAFQGGNDYYFKVAISNTRVPVKQVQVKVVLGGGKGRFDKLVRKPDNYWEYNPMGRKIRFPITLRVTSYLGDTVEETLHVRQPVGVVTGKKQFPLHKGYLAVP